MKPNGNLETDLGFLRDTPNPVVSHISRIILFYVQNYKFPIEWSTKD
jgi:hypothetical protein